MSHLRRWFLTPTASMLGVLFFAPMAIILAYSFLMRGVYGGVTAQWTLENYTRLFDPLYGVILFRTLALSAIATILCLLFGFPLALFISRSQTRKNLYLQLVMLPFWTSFLVRTYAWMFLLRDTGTDQFGAASRWARFANRFRCSITTAPFSSAWFTTYLPFMVLPFYATLERLDRNLLEASADLGAKPWQTMTRVVISCFARPAFRAGAVLVFIPCLGAYLTPDLLGGGRP